MRYIIVFLSILIFFVGVTKPDLTVASSPLNAVVDRNSCTGCNSCVAVCPVKAIENINGKAVINVKKCIGCTLCQKTCPFQAINMEKR